MTEKKRRTSHIVLLALGVFWALFIVAMCVIFCVKGSTPDTLIQCVLGGSGVEIFALAAIKISKIFSGENHHIIAPGEGDDFNDIQNRTGSLG